MSESHHVVVDFAGPRPELVVPPEEQLVLRCMHCGDRYVLPLPVSVTMVSAVTKVYTREHRSCKEREAAK